MDSKIVMVEWMKAGNLSIPSILLKHYTKLGLTDTEFICLLQIYESVERGHHFPTPAEVSLSMNRTVDECSTVFRSLIHKKVLTITQDNVQGKSFSFVPLWTKLTECMSQNTNPPEKIKTVENQENLYTLFEQEFGRPLSPMECESLSMWIDEDKHSTGIIKSALKEAVISRKLNFRYIDRILFDWKKNGVKTIEEAKEYSQRFRGYQRQPQTQDQERTESIPFYNWLEG